MHTFYNTLFLWHPTQCLIWENLKLELLNAQNFKVQWCLVLHYHQISILAWQKLVIEQIVANNTTVNLWKTLFWLLYKHGIWLTSIWIVNMYIYEWRKEEGRCSEWPQEWYLLGKNYNIKNTVLDYADWVSKLEPPFTYDHNHIGHSSGLNYLTFFRFKLLAANTW